MNLSDLIRQQKAGVKSLEKLVKARRASQSELDKAQARLADLEAQEGFRAGVPVGVPVRAAPAPRPDWDRPRVDPPQARTRDRQAEEPNTPIIEGDEYARLQAEMAQEADQLNRKMAGLSNGLHQVPEGVACPELTGPILALKAQIEAIWDRKRYLERNRRLPLAAEAEEKPADSRDAGPPLPDLPDDDPGRFQLAYQKRRLIDQKSKLKRKLADPKARPSKRAEWEQELAQCELKIGELDFNLS